MHVLVIGGSGLVGSSILEAAMAAGHETSGTYRETPTDVSDIQLDKTDPERTMAVVDRLGPDVVVDTAAFHAVDACESHRSTAWAVNAAGTRNVAIAADAVGAQFVYISTDYVFDGEHGIPPYQEDDPVSPVNYYARTKLAGEQAAAIATQWTVLRPSVVYGAGHDNFATWAANELAAGTALDIVEDQISCPTYAPDLGRACLAVAERSLTGLYHATGPEPLSRYEFTTYLAEECGFQKSLLTPVTTDELGQTARRPPNSSLDSSRLYEAIGYSFRPPSEGLAEFCHETEDATTGG